jgi:hypothetical protein
MTTEAEQLANELVGGYLEPTWLESKAAALLRSQAAEIERLKAEAELFAKHIGLVIARKDALLRECLVAFDAVAGKGALCNAAIANIKTELGEV